MIRSPAKWLRVAEDRLPPPEAGVARLRRCEPPASGASGFSRHPGYASVKLAFRGTEA